MSPAAYVALLLRTRLGAESGQVLAWIVLSVVVLLGMAGLAVDVGRAYSAHRKLQASADAAALAAAQDLPDVNLAISTAYAFSSASGGKNAHEDVPGVTTSVTTKCLTTTQISCRPANALVVNEKADVPTMFLRVLGINSIPVSARATASMKGGTAFPLDIMVVLDRTGSMCQSCQKIQNAKAGIKAFLAAMRPSVDRIGLAVFPPAPGASNRCSSSSSAYYDTSSYPYVISPLANDFRTSDTGPLNTSSDIVKAVDCMQTGGATSYATALEKAQAELDSGGRPNARDVIIFFTDGEANYGPWYYSNTSSYRTNPGGQAIASSAAAKAKGTWVYTIAYDTDPSLYSKGYRNVSGCRQGAGQSFQCDERPRITALSTLQQMASTVDGETKFYSQPTPGELETIFERVAIDLSSVRLLDDDTL